MPLKIFYMLIILLSLLLSQDIVLGENQTSPEEQLFSFVGSISDDESTAEEDDGSEDSDSEDSE